MKLDQAIYVRTQQLNGHWTAPERLAEAIATIRQRAAGPEEQKRVAALVRAARREPKR